MAERRLRIVIVGGGFGGLFAAAYLGRSELAERGAEVTLLDRRNFFTFSPLLAEVVAGTLRSEHVTYPLRALARQHGFTFRQDAGIAVDPARQCVRTERGDLPYDYLIIAVGAEPQFFGNEAIERVGFPLTSVRDAIAIRHRVIEMLEAAAVSRRAAERERLLSFVVAGAGPAGVEVASEVQHLLTRVLRPYYPGVGEGRVVLVDSGARILQGFDGDLAAEGLAVLERRGLEVRLGTQVTGVPAGGVNLSTPEGEVQIPSDTLIWTAGTAPNALASNLPFETARGALAIRPTLQVPGHDNVFSIGDVTTLTDPRSGRPYPRVAPIAISQGIRAAANLENRALNRPLEPYQAHHAGKIVSLGHGVALADVLGLKLRGRLAWWLYRSAYLVKLVGTKNKIRVLVSLGLHRLFGPDVT